MTLAEYKNAAARTGHGLLENTTFRSAAALSYYTIFGIFPALILLSAVMSYIPVPNFFSDALVAMARVVPHGTMSLVYSVLIGLLGANLRAWLSLGTIGTLWVLSSAFDEMIDSLDIAYDVPDSRPFWKTRLLALGLATITGMFLIIAIAAMVVGPRAGEWIGSQLSLASLFVMLWPFIHWTIGVFFILLAVQTIYYLAPNLKQHFRATLPGAVLAVAAWIGLSYLLGLYFRYFANYNRIYGTLAGLMALMTWLYWAYFIFLAGAELNAELARQRARRPEQPLAEPAHAPNPRAA